jgi:hypothetical protein
LSFSYTRAHHANTRELAHFFAEIRSKILKNRFICGIMKLIMDVCAFFLKAADNNFEEIFILKGTDQYDSGYYGSRHGQPFRRYEAAHPPYR